MLMMNWWIWGLPRHDDDDDDDDDDELVDLGFTPPPPPRFGQILLLDFEKWTGKQIKQLLFTFVEVADGTVEPCKSGLRLCFS